VPWPVRHRCTTAAWRRWGPRGAATARVAAGFSALSDQTIGAPGDSIVRLCWGTDHHKDEDPGVAQMLDETAILAECKHDDIYPSVEAYRDVGRFTKGINRFTARARPATSART
jgi:hypothetical protein